MYHLISGDEESPTASFMVEEQYDWIALKIHFEKTSSLMLFVKDTNGRLRAQYLDYRNKPVVIIHREARFSSYLTVPGIIPIGEWKIEFSYVPETYRIEWQGGIGEPPEESETMRVEHEFWADTDHELQTEGFALNRYPWDRVLETNQRWYKGDFHVHTTLTDGKMTQIERTQQASQAGLDFFVTTDHDLISTSWPKSDVLVIPGFEVTSKKGHFNAIGIRNWIDWTYYSPDRGMWTEEGMNRLLRQTAEAGGLRSLNHMMVNPWAWLFANTPLNGIDCLEIWNDPTYPSNPLGTEKSLHLWNAIWNEGYTIPGIGGSDVHNRPDESYVLGGPPSIIGDPATYVWADGLSVDHIFQAVRSGRVYVTRGPVLNSIITVNGQTYPLGSDLTEALRSTSDGAVRFVLEVSECTEANIHWIENGVEVLKQRIEGKALFDSTFHWNAEEYNWRRLEIRRDSGELLAFTNPVYCGKREPTVHKWGEMVIKSYPPLS